MSGRVVAVCVSAQKGEKKEPVWSVELRHGHGIVGDAHAGNGHRQVSLLAIESIRKMQRLGLEVDKGDFAENITTEGVDLVSLPIGTQLRVGEALLEVTQIGKECHTRCAIYHQPAWQPGRRIGKPFIDLGGCASYSRKNTRRCSGLWA